MTENPSTDLLQSLWPTNFLYHQSIYLLLTEKLLNWKILPVCIHRSWTLLFRNDGNEHLLKSLSIFQFYENWKDLIGWFFLFYMVQPQTATLDESHGKWINCSIIHIWIDGFWEAGKSFCGARYDYSYLQRVIDLNQTRQRRFKICIPLADSGQSLTEPEPELIDHRSPS